MITSDRRHTHKIKSRIAMAKAEFNKKKKNCYTNKLDLNLRKKIIKCYVWSIDSYGVETSTIEKIDHNHPESFETWYRVGWGRSIGLIVWKMKKDYTGSREGNILHKIKLRKTNCHGYILHGTGLLKHHFEGKIESKRRRGRRCEQPLDVLKEENTGIWWRKH